MCPPNPALPLAALDISIRDSCSDEELVRFLAERKVEDPLPQDVFVSLDISVVDPRAFTADVWYLNWSNNQQEHGSDENGVIKAKNGYWKPVGSSRILTSTGILGVKIVFEFYEGQAPCGKRTGWVMHEYQVEQNDKANLPQEYKSLCKVFLQGDKKINAESQQNHLIADAPNDSLESYLQYLAKLDEPKSIDTSGQDISSSNGKHERKPQSASDYIDVHDIIATGDYIELNDLLSSEASASTSENSSKRSMISEEYFDIDAFLGDILTGSNTSDGQNQDHKLSIAAPSRSSNVVVLSPSEQGLVQIHDDSATVPGTLQQKSVPGRDRDQYLSKGFQQQSPISSCFPSNHVKRSRSNGSSSSQGSIKSQKERSTSKFGKIGKKYCCFGSF